MRMSTCPLRRFTGQLGDEMAIWAPDQRCCFTMLTRTIMSLFEAAQRTHDSRTLPPSLNREMSLLAIEYIEDFLNSFRSQRWLFWTLMEIWGMTQHLKPQTLLETSLEKCHKTSLSRANSLITEVIILGRPSRVHTSSHGMITIDYSLGVISRVHCQILRAEKFVVFRGIRHWELRTFQSPTGLISS